MAAETPPREPPESDGPLSDASTFREIPSRAPDQPSDSSLPASLPASLGPYRLLEEAGGGGMGVVYRAEDTRLGRVVALKLLPPRLADDPVAKARFFQEARAASALEHPNVCTVHEAGQAEDGRLYLVMPFYDGETLGRALRHGPLPVAEAVDVARQTALGLAKAHRQGIVHRDVKPANLMITADGVVKILDFGIAKLAGGESLTRTGVAVGTPPAMAPEQVLGGEVGPWTDLWALGVVLYEMLSGRRPFAGDTPGEIFQAILGSQPAPIARPDVPPRLEEIVRRLLAKEPAARHESADRLAAELRDLERTLAAPAAPEPLSPREGARRHRTPLRIAAALAVLLLGAGALLWRGRGEPGPAAPPSPADLQPAPQLATRLTDQEGAELFPSVSPSGGFFVYARRDGGDLDLFLQRIGGGAPVHLTADSPADDTHPAFSPDGTRIAFRSERDGGGIFLMGATGESVRRLSDFGYHPAWSPDGREVACSSEWVDDPRSRARRSRLWSLGVEKPGRRLLAAEDAIQPSWSPSGGRVAYWGLAPGGTRRMIWTVDRAGGAPVQATDGAAVDWSPVWSPDGRFLYFASDRGGAMSLWRLPIEEATGRTLGTPEPLFTPALWSGNPSVAADGRILYVSREQRTTLQKVALDPDGLGVTGALEPVLHRVLALSHVSVSPDGAWLALANRDPHEDLLVVRSEGGDLRQITDDAALDRAPEWLPGATGGNSGNGGDGGENGDLVFFSNRAGDYQAWSIRRDGSGLHPLTAPRHGAVFRPIASPDGRRLAFALGFGGAAWLDLEEPFERREPRRLPPIGGDNPLFYPSSWTRDGQRLVGNSSQGLAVFSFATGRYERLAVEGSGAVWSRDGHRLLLLDPEGALQVFDTRTRSARRLLAPPAGSRFTSFAVSPDERRLYLLLSVEEGDLWLRGPGSDTLGR